LPKKPQGWQRPFEDPIPLPDGGWLVSLENAANYMMELSKAERELAVWMRGPWGEAGQLQRPLPDAILKIVASGEREDPPPERAQSQQSLPL
jgi:hypothetical protein